MTLDAVPSASARSTADDVVAVARARRAASACRPTRSPRSAAAARVIDALADDVEPALRRLHRLRRAGHHGTSRPSCARSCSVSLIRSHAAGSGPEVEREVVRALMLLRLSTLATGRTGVRPETAAGLRRRCSTPGITPVVHEYGSLGCSGDLAPLAHCALALMGEGDGARRRRRR